MFQLILLHLLLAYMKMKDAQREKFQNKNSLFLIVIQQAACCITYTVRAFVAPARIIKFTLRPLACKLQIQSLFNFRPDTPRVVRETSSASENAPFRCRVRLRVYYIRKLFFAPSVRPHRDVISRKEAAGFVRVIPKNRAFLWVSSCGRAWWNKKSSKTHFGINDTGSKAARDSPKMRDALAAPWKPSHRLLCAKSASVG